MNKKVHVSIWIIIAAVLAGSALSFMLSDIWLRTEKQEMAAELIQQKQDQIIKAQVQTAVGLLTALNNKVKKGEITLAYAKRLGADVVRDLRYGTPPNGYFWVDTDKGVNVVLYGNKNVEGKNRFNDEVKGVKYVQEIIKNGQKLDGGYTDYWYPKPEGKEALAKRSYSLSFAPFGWVVGTGYYLEDLGK